MSNISAFQFFGRENEVEYIDRLIYDNSTILILYGKEGIGKTALINTVFNRHKSPDCDEIFVDTYNKSWESVIFELAQKTIKEIRPKIDSHQLEDLVIEYLTSTHSVLVLDNIDNSINCEFACSFLPKTNKCEILDSYNKGNECNKYRIRRFKEFIEKWDKKSISKSSIVLVVRESKFIEYDNIQTYEVKAFDDKSIWIKILGNDIAKLIDEEKLEYIIDKFKSNTQKFVYLRMCNPGSWDMCKRNIFQINDGDEILENISNKNEKLNLSHFYALGLMEIREFDETLFAYLWDRLGGGSTEEYIDVLRILLQKNAIYHPLEDSQKEPKLVNYNKLEVSTGIHKLLIKRQEEHFGINSGIIPYLISQYYLKKFDESRNVEELEPLERSVKHALSYGSFEVFDEIYTYVFEDSLWSKIRNKGQIIKVERIIDYFDEFLDVLKKSVSERKIDNNVHQRYKEALFSEIDRVGKQYGKITNKYDDAINNFKKNINQTTFKYDLNEEKYYQYSIQIKIEQAKCAADLCKYKDCITELQKAQGLLDARINIDEKIKNNFQTEIRHFIAIACSCMGDVQCIEKYTENVRQAIYNHNEYKLPMSKIELLSLGYLAHEYMFSNMSLALKLGERACFLSKKTDDNNLIKKNYCNYGKILFYNGNWKEAEKYFEEDTEVDRREFGRIALQKALIYIKTNKPEEVYPLLDYYEKEKDDRRRYAVSLAYKSISDYYLGKKSEGRNTILKAIREHSRIGDKRHLILEVLTYIWMVDNDFDGTIDTKHLSNEEYSSIKEYISDLENSDLSSFINFWKECFKTQLLTKNVIKDV